MASRLLAVTAARAVANVRVAPVGACGSHFDARSLIGTREVVGFGFNGQPNYVDRADFPMPAIRWKEPTPDIVVSHQFLRY